MLQRGLSNRPTGAIALLLLGVAYLLNLARTHDHQKFVLETLLGEHVREALVFVQKTGAAVDQVLLSWGETLEGDSRKWGCAKKKRSLAQRTSTAAQRRPDSCNLVSMPNSIVGLQSCCCGRSARDL